MTIRWADAVQMLYKCVVFAGKEVLYNICIDKADDFSTPLTSLGAKFQKGASF